MGCTPSLHSRHKKNAYNRNSGHFSAPESLAIEDTDEGTRIDCGAVQEKGATSKNGKVAYLDALATANLYEHWQQMRSGRKESMNDNIFITNEQDFKVLLVFDEEDEMTEALKLALEALRFQYTFKQDEHSALESFEEQRYQLIIIDHRKHTILDSQSLCKAITAKSHDMLPLIVLVVNKTSIDNEVEILRPILSTGVNRLMMETCSVQTCILEIIQMEQSLHQRMNMFVAKETFYTVLEGIMEAVVIVNKTNIIQFVNKTYENLLGYKRSEIIGMNLQESFGMDFTKSDCSSETNGKHCEGEVSMTTKTNKSILLHYRATMVPHQMNSCFVVYLKEKLSSVNKSSLTDVSYDIQNYLRGSVKSAKRSQEFRSSSGDSGAPMFSRRQSVAKLHAMTIEAPLTKVISIITAVSENSPPGTASSLETVLDILRSTELYNPQHLTNQNLNSSEDQTTTDLVGGLLHQDPKKPTQSMYRRQSQENSSLKGYNQGGLQLIPDFDSAPSALKSILMKESQWDFDVISLEKLTSKRPLVWLGMMIFARFDACERLECDERTLHKWLTLMEANYHSSNSYHNSTHAADVLQATAYFLRTNRLKTMFDSMDEIACLIAAVIHDVDHPGKTSAFLCNSNNDLAILYNDLAVLESHHSALAFKLMRSSEKVNIFQSLEPETYRSLRKSIVDMVLATEMTKHFEHLSKFINVFTKPAFDAPEIMPVSNEELDIERLITPENIVLIKRILIKCADVNNPLRPLHLCKEWAHRIAEEYFEQTDQEKKCNLPVMMPAFDRTTCNIAKSQIGFIDYFINDMFAAWDAFVDMPELMTQLKSSYNYWKEQEQALSPTSIQQLPDVEEINLEREEAEKSSQ